MQGNRLLASVRRRDHRQLLAATSVVTLNQGDILWEPRRPIRHAYFPLDCFISQLVPVGFNQNLELALVGNEGMLGAPLILGVNSSNLQALVHDSGAALRISASSFRRELDRLPALQRQLNRYAYVLQAQLALTAVCLRFHSLDLRVARWLLMAHDRAGSTSFRLTHKGLAKMLGVRRVGVTNAAGRLQKLRLLSYSRGEITILNRGGLESAACSCYQRSKDAYEDMVG
jgi:hypothetical protein